MIRKRSLHAWSPALADRTSPAAIAASLIIWHPVASHAAGTVSHTSAESDCIHKATVSARTNPDGEWTQTEVGNSTDFACDLLLRVVPETREEVDDEIDSPLSGLTDRT